MRVGAFSLTVLLGALALGANGCASRVRGDATARTADRAPDTVRRGYATWGSAVRLRTDTPELSSVLPTAEPREFASGPPPPASEIYGPDYGPAGAPGAVGGLLDPYGGMYGAYGAPGGVVPPGLRPPPPLPPASPFAGPYARSYPSSDVTSHRPGLSTGSGVWARPDTPTASSARPKP